MGTHHTRKGWLAGLRRFSGVGALLFALVVLVGTARAQALAFAAGDDELCVAMGFLGIRATPTQADPSDLADDHHACCDLGFCLDASALPPSVPDFAAAGRRARRLARSLPPSPVRRRHRRAGHRPRDPPGA